MQKYALFQTLIFQYEFFKQLEKKKKLINKKNLNVKVYCCDVT